MPFQPGFLRSLRDGGHSVAVQWIRSLLTEPATETVLGMTRAALVKEGWVHLSVNLPVGSKAEGGRNARKAEDLSAFLRSMQLMRVGVRTLMSPDEQVRCQAPSRARALSSPIAC
eukprot:828307-Pleurochrysis_carterae.AAC.1